MHGNVIGRLVVCGGLVLAGLAAACAAGSSDDAAPEEGQGTTSTDAGAGRAAEASAAATPDAAEAGPPAAEVKEGPVRRLLAGTPAAASGPGEGGCDRACRAAGLTCNPSTRLFWTEEDARGALPLSELDEGVGLLAVVENAPPGRQPSKRVALLATCAAEVANSYASGAVTFRPETTTCVCEGPSRLVEARPRSSCRDACGAAGLACDGRALWGEEPTTEALGGARARYLSDDPDIGFWTYLGCDEAAPASQGGGGPVSAPAPWVRTECACVAR